MFLFSWNSQRNDTKKLLEKTSKKFGLKEIKQQNKQQDNKLCYKKLMDSLRNKEKIIEKKDVFFDKSEIMPNGLSRFNFYLNANGDGIKIDANYIVIFDKYNHTTFDKNQIIQFKNPQNTELSLLGNLAINDRTLKIITLNNQKYMLCDLWIYMCMGTGCGFSGLFLYDYQQDKLHYIEGFREDYAFGDVNDDNILDMIHIKPNDAWTDRNNLCLSFWTLSPQKNQFLLLTDDQKKEYNIALKTDDYFLMKDNCNIKIIEKYFPK